ncbi:hypothetical protein BV25DRAFT_1919342 [Artomyces pyxidatus]|uniref:Uncharacterized protein n=1 Tax=Artomyces pyxidatus TaxID=48021 RepID=A0ACB8SRJ3_9AGAM|nr:hypothetical protein BV25DRAFT_1919342 [Artomyces pyxidatus]
MPFTPTRTKAEYAPLTGSPTDGVNDDLNEQAEHYRATCGEGHASWKIYASCFIIACLSFFNLSLLPFTLTTTRLTDEQLAILPYPRPAFGSRPRSQSRPEDACLPLRVAREHRTLEPKAQERSLWVEEYRRHFCRGLQRHAIPCPANRNRCLCGHLVLGPPVEGRRSVDLETKGDVSQIEVWSVIAPNPVTGATPGSPASAIDFDTLSWNTRPIQSEFLGTLDLTARPNSTTVEFACPEEEILTIELRCLRVACHVRFQQVHFFPKLGFELVRRQIH